MWKQLSEMGFSPFLSLLRFAQWTLSSKKTNQYNSMRLKGPEGGGSRDMGVGGSLPAEQKNVSWNNSNSNNSNS